MSPPRLGLLFGFDWDADGFESLHDVATFDRAGFDLFTFPSNARLIGFDLQRFAAAQASRGARRGWQGVISHYEQFGALAAALVAERLGLPGVSVEAVLAVQHKLHARRVLAQVAPEASVDFAELDVDYNAPIPEGLHYPLFVKPVKAAFSVLARQVHSRAELQAHTRFGVRELWVIRRLVEPFERIVRERLPQAGSAHRLLLETPVPASTPQFNLDGWVFDGGTHALGVVDAIMYPGTQAFMRWEFPGRLPAAVQARALDIAKRFLAAIGYAHGFFNMEFFYDRDSDRLTVIEFNPRLASQFADLYRRVLGMDAHRMSVALALGQDPALLPRSAPSAGIAASQVYRVFSPEAVVAMPTPQQREQLVREFPDALLFTYPKRGHSLERDFKWLGNSRYGIVHLGASDAQHLRAHTLQASKILGWTAPYADQLHEPIASGWPARQTAYQSSGGNQ